MAFAVRGLFLGVFERAAVHNGSRERGLGDAAAFLGVFDSQSSQLGVSGVRGPMPSLAGVLAATLPMRVFLLQCPAFLAVFFLHVHPVLSRHCPFLEILQGPSAFLVRFLAVVFFDEVLFDRAFFDAVFVAAAAFLAVFDVTLAALAATLAVFDAAFLAAFDVALAAFDAAFATTLGAILL